VLATVAGESAHCKLRAKLRINAPNKGANLNAMKDLIETVITVALSIAFIATVYTTGGNLLINLITEQFDKLPH
jgi:hypothetical protein